MGKPTGFMEIRKRDLPDTRPVEERIQDWREVYLPFAEPRLKSQASRCMDCGVPFCHQGCPLGNIIPDWNDLVYRNLWRDAIDRLHLTNNFPEFTGRLCPAPCEASCVLGINEPAVTIKQIEKTIVERAWKEGWIKPQPPEKETGKSVGVIGSGPAGLACAQQLRRVGHKVALYERSDRIGGLLRYGIPEFKMEKKYLDRRLNQMAEEGVEYVANAHVGVNVSVEDLRGKHDALVLCGGASHPRDLPVPGRELEGTYFAVPFLTQANKTAFGDEVKNQVTAKDKHVVILGGGDTGADCLGTVIRQGARQIHQYELLPRPPLVRAPNNPWPEWPRTLRTERAHEECEARDYNIQTVKLTGENGKLKYLHAVKLDWVFENSGPPKPKPVPGSEFTIRCDLLLLAMGFLGPEKPGMLERLGVELDARGNVKANADKMTSVPGVFTAGDMTRGQSLIVWAIAEGRTAAHGVDKYLMGETVLPRPL
ncbi:MAG: glutamate synthase subunit beta [Planctomycetota bacterium]|nr:glutamate synthase subunit beta [Planctomycetota bacterium]